MSHLILSTLTETFTMNVTAFSSPIYSTINTAQTKREAIHFPIRIDQPEIQFDVVFASEREFEAFQRFVRNHQQTILATTSLLTLQWPERNIFNWSGTIRHFQAGGMRFNYTPRARFVVDLVNSAASSRTDFASVASGWQAIFGAFGPLGSVLAPPTLADANELAAKTGQNIFAGGLPAASGTTPAPSGTVPANPPADRGILTGTS